MVTALEVSQKSGADETTLKRQETEIERLDQDMLSLDHFHELESQEAMTQLTKFRESKWEEASGYSFTFSRDHNDE